MPLADLVCFSNAMKERTKLNAKVKWSAFATALVATGVGFSQSLIYINPPVLKVIAWFPAAIIVKHFSGDPFAMVIVALMQFPLLAGLGLTILRYRGPIIAISA